MQIARNTERVPAPTPLFGGARLLGGPSLRPKKRSRRWTRAVVSAIDLRGAARVDVLGAGDGALLLELLPAHPHVRGVAFDRPHAIPSARAAIAAAGLSRRCVAVAGDPADLVPPGADACLLSDVVSSCSDEACARILSNCHAALDEGGRVVVAQRLRRARETSDNRGEGRVRTARELRVLLARAGFALASVVSTVVGVSVFEGRRR